MYVFKITTIDDAIVAAFNRLMPQLSSETTILTHADLMRMVQMTGTTLFAASDADQICGLLTLTVYESPSGVKGMIDDVVVDGSRRGGGIGSMLVAVALETALEAGVDLVSLTSGFHREAAHALYLKMGFKEPTSKLYRFYPTHGKA